MHVFGKFARLLQARRRGLPPEEISVTGEGQASLDAMGKARAGLQAVEAFGGAFTADELAITLVNIGVDVLGAFRVLAFHFYGDPAATENAILARGVVASEWE